MPYRNGNIVWNATRWTQKMEDFLKKNFYTMTNPQLAKALNLRLTITRMKCAELGLKRIEMEYWTPEQVEFLKANYKTKGDVELAEIFEKCWPKNKKWTKQHINKKRRYMKLSRTVEEIHAIASVNSSPGGKSFTIDKNSSSVNMHDTWVAQQIAWRDPELRKEVLKHPDIIDAARTMIKLKKVIKNTKKHEKA